MGQLTAGSAQIQRNETTLCPDSHGPGVSGISQETFPHPTVAAVRNPFSGLAIGLNTARRAPSSPPNVRVPVPPVSGVCGTSASARPSPVVLTWHRKMRPALKFTKAGCYGASRVPESLASGRQSVPWVESAKSRAGTAVFIAYSQRCRGPCCAGRRMAGKREAGMPCGSPGKHGRPGRPGGH